MQNREESVASGKAWISWLLAIAGWLICAGFCLAVTVGLEIYAYAYDVVFPAVMIMLFGNILVFMFISSRFGNYPRKMFSSIIRVCAGEGIILAGLYLIGRYCIGY